MFVPNDAKPGARPTNDTLIKFETQLKFGVL